MFPSAAITRGVAGLLVAFAGATPAHASGISRLFDSTWMGFNTGFYGEGFGPTDVAAGDLDGDGAADLLVGQGYFGYPGVSILLSCGDGSYSSALYTPLPTNDSVGRVALADIDGDSDLDVMATIPDAWSTGNQVALWRNDGSAGLTGPERLFSGTAPLGLILADIDGDGHADLLTANTGEDTVSLFRHNGLMGPLAAFSPAVSITVGFYPQTLAAGDLDGDGKLDVAVARADPFVPAVTLLINNGAGGFRAPVDVAVGVRGGPVIALGDMDNDSDLDIVVGRHENSSSQSVILVMHNDGNGTFPNSVETRLDSNSPYPADLAVADLNRDGFLDVAAVSPTTRFGDGFRVMLSDGFGAYGPITAYAGTQESVAVLAIDADGDSDADVLTIGRYSAALTVALNPGDGVFPSPIANAVSGFTRGIDGGDVDNDGDLDVVTAASVIEFHRNLGGGRFAPAVTIPMPATMGDVKLRDLDGDGNLDLLLGPDSLPGFDVARGNGDGTFSGAVAYPFACGGPLDAFDLDGDGDLDVVMPACASAFDYYALIARNEGGLVYSLMPNVPITVTANRAEAADLDGDGKLDLVLNESGYGLATFHGFGDCTFGPEVVSGGTPPTLFTLGDFDGDTRVDAGMVIGQSSFGTDFAGIARGIGDGTFLAPTILQAGSSTLENLALTKDVDAGDVDCDGIVDLVTTCYASSDLGVFRSNRDGTLAPQTRHDAGLQGMVSTLGDFTGDGQIDIATVALPINGTLASYALYILPGRCPCIGPDPVPPDQGNVLRAVRRDRDVELTWTGTSATRFRVTRDDHKTKLGRSVIPPDLAITTYVDIARVASPTLDHYRIKGLADCSGTPGP